MVTDIRAAQSRAKQPPAAEQSRRRDACIARGTYQRRQLARLPHNRAEDRGDIRRAVLPQSVHSGRRKLAAGGIDDHPIGRERNPVRRGNTGRDMGLRVDGRGPGSRVKPILFLGSCDRGIEPDDIGVDGAGKRLDKSLCPDGVGRKASLLGLDAGLQPPSCLRPARTLDRRQFQS